VQQFTHHEAETMLRPELQALAKAGATCLVEGRVMEIRRLPDGERVDLLLKRCDVRQLEPGRPCDLHPAVRTDHLWLRLPVKVLAPRETKATWPWELQQACRREGITMLQEVCLVGTCGFYAHADGQLGIGIVKVVPTVPERALQAATRSALRDFRSNPADPAEMEYLETVFDLVISELRGEHGAVVISPYGTDHIVPRLRSQLERCRRDHQAELRAAAGAAKARRAALGSAPLAPCLMPTRQGDDPVALAANLKPIDALLARADLAGRVQASQDVHRVKPPKR